MQKITPFLWYDNNAEEAVSLYISVFKTRRSPTSRVTAMPDRARRDRS